MVKKRHLHEDVGEAGIPTRSRPVVAQGFGDRGLPAAKVVLVEVEQEHGCEVACRRLVEESRIEGRAAVLVRHVEIRAVADEHLDRLLVPQEGGSVQGRPAVIASDVHVRTSVDQPLDGLCATGSRGPHQRRAAAIRVASIHRDPVLQVPIDGVQVTGSRGHPNRRRTRRRCFGAGLPSGRGHREGGDPHRERDDREQPHDQREEHPVESMLDQRAAAPPVEQHRAEVAAHHEEQRHPKTVDGREHDSENVILPSIRDDPEAREEREGGVQDDPQQHGAGPERVQVGSSGQGCVFGAHARHSPDPAQYLANSSWLA